VENVIVNERGEQIMAGRDRMRVAGEMQIDVLHRDDLCTATSCAAAFDPEYGPQRGLTQRHDSALPDPAQSLRRSSEERLIFPLCRP
jgi:hypothetical protein